jgi:hypothetical protein
MEASVRTGRRKTNDLQYTDDTTMPTENKENKVELAERVENGRESAGFKLNVKKNSEMSTGGEQVKISVKG